MKDTDVRDGRSDYRRYGRLGGLVGAALVVLGVQATPLAAEVYVFVDKQGVVSLTNVPTNSHYKKIDLFAATSHAPMAPSTLEPAIARAAQQTGLHPALVRAIIKTESNYDPMAVSRAGALGLMQLMPQTAERHQVADVFDPEQNISGGTKHLRYLLDRFQGNLPLALAAYNAGESAVDRYRSLPPYNETRRYVQKVLRYYRHFLVGARSSTVPALTASADAMQLPVRAASVEPQP